MTHGARRNLRRIGIFLALCFFVPGAIALLEATFGFRTPRWVLPACLACALPVAEWTELALERREDERFRRRCSPTALSAVTT